MKPEYIVTTKTQEGIKMALEFPIGVTASEFARQVRSIMFCMGYHYNTINKTIPDPDEAWEYIKEKE
jgi:hypothetical protein